MKKAIYLLLPMMLLGAMSYGQTKDNKIGPVKTAFGQKSGDSHGDANADAGQPRKAAPKGKKEEKHHKHNRAAKENKGTAVKDSKSKEAGIPAKHKSERKLNSKGE